MGDGRHGVEPGRRHLDPLSVSPAARSARRGHTLALATPKSMTLRTARHAFMLAQGTGQHVRKETQFTASRQYLQPPDPSILHTAQPSRPTHNNPSRVGRTVDKLL